MRTMEKLVAIGILYWIGVLFILGFCAYELSQALDQVQRRGLKSIVGEVWNGPSPTPAPTP